MGYIADHARHGAVVYLNPNVPTCDNPLADVDLTDLLVK